MAKKITGKDLKKLITTTVKSALEEAERLKAEPPGKKPKDKKDKKPKEEKKSSKGFLATVASWIDDEEDEEEEDEDGDEEDGEEDDGEEDEEADDDEA